MGEAVRGVRRARPGRWDLGYRAIGRDWEVFVCQVVGHACQNLLKQTEKLGGVYLPHWQDQVNAYDAAFVHWCQWGDNTSAPTCAGLTVPQPYVSITSSLETRTRPWTGSASHTTYMMQEKAQPNCSESGAVSLLDLFQPKTGLFSTRALI